MPSKKLKISISLFYHMCYNIYKSWRSINIIKEKGLYIMKNNKSKKNLIIGCSVGAVVCIVTAIVVFMLVRGGEKTVSCTEKTTVMGITTETETNVKVTKGKLLGGNVSAKVDISSLSDLYKKNESTMVENFISTMKKQLCKEDCNFTHNHVPGESITVTVEYGEKGVKTIVRSYGNVEAMSSQEIADKVEKALEVGNATCEQH